MREISYLSFWEDLRDMMVGDGRIDLFLCEGMSNGDVPSYVVGSPVVGEQSHSRLSTAAVELKQRLGVTVDVVPRIANTNHDDIMVCRCGLPEYTVVLPCKKLCPGAATIRLKACGARISCVVASGGDNLRSAQLLPVHPWYD
jgi:hypothetical protein